MKFKKKYVIIVILVVFLAIIVELHARQLNSGLIIISNSSGVGVTYGINVTYGTDGTYSNSSASSNPLRVFVPPPLNNFGAAYRQVKIVSLANPSRNETVFAGLEANGNLFIFNCSNQCSNKGDWGYIGNITNASTIIDSVMQNFDMVALDQNQVMLVFGNNTTPGKVYYCIWNGSIWSPAGPCTHALTDTFIANSTNEINLGLASYPNWVKLREKNGKVLMGVNGNNSASIWADREGTGLAVALWNGTAWTNNITLSNHVGQYQRPGFDIAWEGMSSEGEGQPDAIAVFDEGPAVDGVFNYSRFNGTNNTWDPSPRFVRDTGSLYNNQIVLASDPNSEKISMIIVDGGDDVNAYMWKLNPDVEAWTHVVANEADLTILSEGSPAQVIGTVWSESGNALYYYTNKDLLQPNIVCWSGSTNFTIDEILDFGGNDDLEQYKGKTAIRGSQSMILAESINDTLTAIAWNGSVGNTTTTTQCGVDNFQKLPPDKSTTAVLNPYAQNRLGATSDNNPAFSADFDFDAFVFIDTTPPQYFNATTNQSEIFQNDYVIFSANWTDDFELDTYIFAIDQGSGTIINSSAVRMATKSGISNLTKLITAPPGYNVTWRFYVNDTSNNINMTQNSFVIPLNQVCGGLTTSITLGNPVNSTAGCFTIKSDNVVLNCAGNLVNYSIANVTTGYGIYNAGYDNVTIKNCVIREGNVTQIGAIAIYFLSNASSSTVFNNTISTQSERAHGMYIINSFFNNVTSNIVLAQGAISRGIFYSANNNSYINFNNVTVTNTGTAGYGAIELSVADSNNISYNNITADSTGMGILLGISSFNTVDHNNIYTTGYSGYGLYVRANSDNNTLSYNVINTTGVGGNGFINWPGASGVADNNSILFNRFDVLNGHGLVHWVGGNNIAKSNKVNRVNLSYADISFNASDNGPFVVINLTTNTTKPYITFSSTYAYGSIQLQYYLTPNLTSYSYANLAGINLSVYNISNDLLTSNITNAQGQIPTLLLTEYIINGTGTYPQTPHNFTTNSTNIYGANSTLLNLSAFTSSNTLVDFVYNLFMKTEVSACGTLTSSTTLINNVEATGTCFIIGANNIILNCAGNYINYSTASTLGYGIDGSAGFDNITIKNCFIYEGNTTTSSKHGIYFNLTENSTVYNNTVYTTGASSSPISFTMSKFNINISRNALNNSGANTISLDFVDVNHSAITDNSITISVGSNIFNGIRVANSSFNNVTNNNIVVNAISSGSAIQVNGTGSVSTRNKIDFNTLTGTSISTSLNAIHLDTTINTNVSFNTITANLNDINLINAQDTIIDNNLLLGTRVTAIVASSSNNTNITSNRIFAGGGANKYGITISSSGNLIIASNNITLSGATLGYGIGLAGATNLNISSNNITISTGTTNNGISLVSSEVASYGIIEKNNIMMPATTLAYGGIVIKNKGQTSFSLNLTSNLINSSSAATPSILLIDNIINMYLSNNNLTLNIKIANSTATFYNTTFINDSAELFYPNITFFGTENTETYGNISAFNNTVFVNATRIPPFNTTANITFTSGLSYVSLSNYNVIRDAITCPASICTKINFNPVRFQVTGFTELFGYNTTLAAANTPPTNVTLIAPSQDNRTLLNRTVTFQWFNASDVDNDNITYNLVVDDIVGFTSPAINITIPGTAGSTNTTYYSTGELLTDTVYYWQVIANDSTTNGSASEIRNFTIPSTVAIALPTDTVNFTVSSVGDILDTTTYNPGPIIIRNDGNVLADINLSLIEDLWLRSSAPSAFFKYKIDNTTQETGSFNATGSVTSWTNIPITNGTAIKQLNYTESNDTAEIDIRITVPPDEPAGTRGAVIEIIGWVSS